MTVRAKFKVDRISKTVNGTEIDLVPVTCGSKENERFFQCTPYGSMKMGVVKPEAAEQFKPGDEFYVDFTPAQ